MFLKRFYDDGLAQASYMIGCQATGEAIVIDANRDIQPYLDTAAAERLRITHVSETHIHADYVSGSRELAKRTGATLYLSAEGGKDWQYAFAAGDGATLVHDGDVITLGNVKLTVMHTPGHTPEHIAFLVTDGAAANEPMGIVTGDFVFVGDVGRPDLLERAAKIANTMEVGARTLFKSLEKFRALPDYLQVWPGHGAGSACGKALGAVPTSTVGYEKRFNWGVGTTDEETFVTMVLAGQPEPPGYFAEMKRVNRDGPTLLHALPTPPEGDLAALDQALAAKRLVVDIRSADEFARAHVPGTLNIPLNKSFSSWAGTLVPFGVDFDLLGPRADLARATRALALIGLERVKTVYDAGIIPAWTHAGRTAEKLAKTDVNTAAPRILSGEVAVLDVRNTAEWGDGHMPGAVHIPLAQLEARVKEVPRGKPLLVSCQSGGRSAIAASLLLKHGVTAVTNLTGGYSAWVGARHPVEGAAKPAKV